MFKCLSVLFIGFLFLACESPVSKGSSGPTDPIDPAIVVTSAEGVLNSWYNVDGNTIDWNAAYFDSTTLDIVITNSDQSYTAVFADDVPNNGSFTNTLWVYDMNYATEAMAATIDVGIVRLEGTDFIFTLVDDHSNPSETASSDSFSIVDASQLVRNYGDLDLYEEGGTLRIRSYSAWAVDVSEWSLQSYPSDVYENVYALSSLSSTIVTQTYNDHLSDGSILNIDGFLDTFLVPHDVGPTPGVDITLNDSSGVQVDIEVYRE